MQRIKIILMLSVCSLSIMTGCTCATSKKASTTTTPQSFTTPQIPAILTSAEQKAEFVVTHYWDNYNFADTTLISRADYTEQAYADFVNILPNVPVALAQRGIDTLMSRATADRTMYTCFMDLSEKYLYDPNSPFRNEELYIAVLRNIVANSKLPEIEKVRPQFQLNLALKNRIGEKAIDFWYTTDKGKKATLYEATGDPLMLFFFRPDCPTCKQVKEYVTSQGIDKLVKIVWINPDADTHIDSLYDLRASPTLYLLDKNKVVLLKDTPIEQIETHIKTLKRRTIKD